MLRDKLLSLYRDAPPALSQPDDRASTLAAHSQYYLASYLGIEPESLSRLKQRVYQRGIS